MPDQDVPIDLKSGHGGKLVYDKERRTIVRTIVGKAQSINDAPRDGTHILAFLYSEPDDCGYKGFGEWREIWWKPYTSIGMFCPWHAGDPFDSHTLGEAPEHYGEGVPIAWMPLPDKPRRAR